MYCDQGNKCEHSINESIISSWKDGDHYYIQQTQHLVNNNHNNHDGDDDMVVFHILSRSFLFSPYHIVGKFSCLCYYCLLWLELLYKNNIQNRSLVENSHQNTNYDCNRFTMGTKRGSHSIRIERKTRNPFCIENDNNNGILIDCNVIHQKDSGIIFGWITTREIINYHHHWWMMFASSNNNNNDNDLIYFIFLSFHIIIII